MSIKERLSGNEAVANAMRQINPDVMPAYPITPSTEIPQYFTSFVSNGKVDTVFIPVESEHSAMSACVGSEAARSKNNHSNFFLWSCSYVGDSHCCRFRQTSDLSCSCKPYTFRSY